MNSMTLIVKMIMNSTTDEALSFLLSPEPGPQKTQMF